MCRNGHDRAGAVRCENVVGDEDRNRLAVDGIDAHDAVEPYAGLLLIELRALEIALAGRLLLVGLHLVGICELARLEPLRDKRMFGGKHHVRRTEESVAASREDGDILVIARNTEIDEGAGGFPDPVALHLLDALRPVEVIEILEKPLGIFRDLEHPLTHRPAFDRMVAALRTAVYDLFVRKHRAERGAPVHRHLRDIGKPLLVELLENPLRPLVVLRIGRVHLTVPVVREAKHADLLAEAVDILLCGDFRMRAGFDGVLLGGKAECVPAHRMKHVKALHALVAAEDVRGRVAFRMSHVQPRPRRIREHVETVELLLRVVPSVALERLVGKPICLPLLLYC